MGEAFAFVFGYDHFGNVLWIGEHDFIMPISLRRLHFFPLIAIPPDTSFFRNSRVSTSHRIAAFITFLHRELLQVARVEKLGRHVRPREFSPVSNNHAV